MGSPILLPAIFFTALFRSSVGDELVKLELVQVLFRHGERTPMLEEFRILNYTDQQVYEPFGLGQLTNNGKIQAYKVGQMLRQRYNDFINDTYHRHDIFAQSAEDDRAQMSLQLLLAGLYPKPDWNSNLTWSPIPYRCVPKRMDVLFRQFTIRVISGFKKVLGGMNELPVVREKLNEFSDLFEFFKGKGTTKMNTTLELFRMYNVLLINSRMNVTLPTWYSDDVMSRLREFLILYMDCVSLTPELKRILTGPLVKTFLERMNLNESTSNPRKMYLYSGSEVNVGAVSRALRVDGFRYPDFSSALVLEKLRGLDGQLYVRVLEWDAISETLVGRKMEECAELCPADDFLRICSELIPSDEDMRYLVDDFRVEHVVDQLVKDPLVT